MATVVDDGLQQPVVVRTIDVTPEPPTPAGNSRSGGYTRINDKIADAWTITVPSGYGSYRTGPLDSDQYSKSADEPVLAGDWEAPHTAWWRYEPPTSGTLSVYQDGTRTYSTGFTDAEYINFVIFKLETDGSYTYLNGGSNYQTGWSVTAPVTAGEVYYVRMSLTYNAGSRVYYKLTARGPSASEAPVNDLRSGAATLVVPATGGTCIAAPVPTGALTTDFVSGADDRDPGDLPGSPYRKSAWWKYQPLTAGTLTIWYKVENRPTGLDNMAVYLLSGTNTLTYVTSFASSNQGVVSGTVSVVQNLTYYLMAGLNGDDNGNNCSYTLQISGPATAVPTVVISAPPVALTLAPSAPTVPVASVAAPAVSLTVATAQPALSVAAVSAPVVALGLNTASPAAVAPQLAVPPAALALAVPDWAEYSPTMVVPPVGLGVNFSAATPVPVGFLSAPPVQLGVTVQPAKQVQLIAAPPLQLGATAPTPAAAVLVLFLTSPADGEQIPTTRPEFVVGLDQSDEDVTYTIQIQYSPTSTFPSGSTLVTLTEIADPLDGGVSVPAPTDVSATTYWRARVLFGGSVVLDWSAAQVFTVSVTTVFTVPVTWTVAAGAQRPLHLWHLDPPAGEPGDLATLYGQGFPLTAGTITIADVPVDIDSWTLVPATATATADRVINGDVVDPEHFEVVFTVPEVDEPGGPLVVEA